ncbi:odorant-binding protein 4 [Aphomia sociella]
MFFRLLFLSCFILTVYARTPEEIKGWFMQQGLVCNNEYPINPDQMKMLQRHKIPDSENVKCLLACVFKKAQWLSDSGTFEVEKAKSLSDEEFANSPDKKENAAKLFDECKSVNDKPAADGAKGCDRSYLVAHCLVDNAPKLASVEAMDSDVEARSISIVDVLLTDVHRTALARSLANSICMKNVTVRAQYDTRPADVRQQIIINSLN